MARSKVVPPVTPRIVQHQPGRRVVWILLLLGLVPVALWVGYDLGRAQAPATDHAARPSSAQQDGPQLAAVGKERDALRAQLKTMQQQLQQAERALARARVEKPAAQKVPVPPADVEPAPVAVTASTATISTDPGLQLANVHIEPGAESNLFRLSLSVMHKDLGRGQVVGTIWIAVNGFMNGAPERLSFKRLSAKRRAYLKMNFDQQQDISEDLLLPDGFRPQNILIEAKPYGDKYTATLGKYPWLSGDG